MSNTQHPEIAPAPQQAPVHDEKHLEVTTAPQQAPVHNEKHAQEPQPAQAPPQYSEAAPQQAQPQQQPQQPQQQQQPYPAAQQYQQGPPPQQYQQGAPQQQQYVTPLERLSVYPAYVDCPWCHQRTMTRIRQEDSDMTTLADIVCCLICLPLVCVPSLLHWFADIDHYCTNCDKRVAHQPHNGQMQPVLPPTHLSNAPVVSRYAQPTPQPVYQQPLPNNAAHPPATS